MSTERFQYLLRCYKLNQLSEQDWYELRGMIKDEEYRPIIESDIESYMYELFFHQKRNLETVNKIWESILKVVGEN